MVNNATENKLDVNKAFKKLKYNWKTTRQCNINGFTKSPRKFDKKVFPDSQGPTTAIFALNILIMNQETSNYKS